MNYVLHEYILKENVPCESIVNESLDISFESYVVNKINSFSGKTDRELCSLFQKNHNLNKAEWNNLSFKMLGIKSNRAEEFLKANISVKTIRVESDGHIRESMSFPAFRFDELINEEWENSTIYNYFETTRFLFVVFKKEGDDYVLRGSKMWNMPYKDLNNIVKDGWLKIQQTIKNGVIFKITYQKDGKVIIKNNLPKHGDNPIIHLRPHAQKAAYNIKGLKIGNVERDGDVLPNGEIMTKQCFWINNSYIEKQIKDLI